MLLLSNKAIIKKWLYLFIVFTFITNTIINKIVEIKLS